MKPPLILVVDDEADLREVERLHLESIGYLVEEASNGRDALETVAADAPALVLLDMRMPVMNGWRFIAECRARFGRRFPIVIVTAAEDAAAIARQVGAEAWLAKPFDLDALTTLVERFAGPPVPAPVLRGETWDRHP